MHGISVVGELSISFCKVVTKTFFLMKQMSYFGFKI